MLGRQLGPGAAWSRNILLEQEPQSKYLQHKEQEPYIFPPEPNRNDAIP
jgi:hypothetical protein